LELLSQPFSWPFTKVVEEVVVVTRLAHAATPLSGVLRWNY